MFKFIFSCISKAVLFVVSGIVYRVIMAIVMFGVASYAFAQLKKEMLNGETLGEGSIPQQVLQMDPSQFSKLKEQLQKLMGDSELSKKASQLLQSLSLDSSGGGKTAQMDQMMKVLNDSKDQIEKRNEMLKELIDE